MNIRKLTFKTKRFLKHTFQIAFRGFSDRETWNLNTTFAKFMLPRLIRYRQLCDSYPPYELDGNGNFTDVKMTHEKFLQIIDDGIVGLRYFSNEEGYFSDEDENDPSMELFKTNSKRVAILMRYFGTLWW